MGRHRKLNDEQIKEICQLSEEVSYRDLAKRFGVSYITILNYRKKYGKQNQQSPETDPYLV